MAFPRTFAALWTICALWCFAPYAGMAQNSSASRLNKNLIGTWKVQDVEITLDETNASPEDKQEFQEVQNNLYMMKAMMIGKITFTFYENGTYLSQNQTEGVTDEEKGTWTLEGTSLLLKADGEDHSDYVKASIKDNILRLSIVEEPMTIILKFNK